MSPFEVEVVTESGNRVPFELSTDPVYEDGEINEILAVARNISDLKERGEIQNPVRGGQRRYLLG